jgi:hypothetical protein
MGSQEEGTEETWKLNFTSEELAAIHRPELKDVLDLKEVSKDETRVLYSYAYNTLGYEVRLRKVRDDFGQRLFRTVKDAVNVNEDNLLATLDSLGRELGKTIFEMMAKESKPYSDHQPIQEALLIRTRNEQQAREAVRYLQAAEVAMTDVLPVQARGQKVKLQLADTYSARSNRAYLPAIRTYYQQKGDYIRFLIDRPGTPFYPGRPPKRRRILSPYALGLSAREDDYTPPWRPVYRRWVDAPRKPETTEWDILEKCITERASRTTNGTQNSGARKSLVHPAGWPYNPISPAFPPELVRPQTSHGLVQGQYDVVEESHAGVRFEKSPKPDSDEVCLCALFIFIPIKISRLLGQSLPKGRCGFKLCTDFCAINSGGLALTR